MKHIITTLLLLCCALTASADVTPWAWEGKLNGNISFRLEIEESTFGTLIGQTTYFRKNGKTAVIPCYGHRVEYDDDENIVFMLDEYDGTKQCGHFYIDLCEGKLVEGNWSLLNKTYEMSHMVDLEPIPGTEHLYHPVSNIDDACGEYSFIYDSGNEFTPEYGGSCTITKTGPNTIHWSMAQVTPNIAEAEGDSEFNGSYFVGHFGDFTFEAYVDRRFIYVKNTNDSPFEMDEWGAWSTIEGIYVRK